MTLKDAIKPAKGGVIIELEVTPGSKKLGVSGYNSWRKRIELKLTAQAQKGQANEQLISFLAELFKVPASDITLKGATGEKKSVRINGVTPEDAVNILEKVVKV